MKPLDADDLIARLYNITSDAWSRDVRFQRAPASEFDREYLRGRRSATQGLILRLMGDLVYGPLDQGDESTRLRLIQGGKTESTEK